MYKAVKDSKRVFPGELNLKRAISVCDFDERGALRFRNRVWIPDYKPLQIALIQRRHDSYITGNPGRDSTYAILSRNFSWPGASSMVQTFCKNCDVYRHSRAWRENKRGLVLPLTIREIFHAELSIDFMTDLPVKSNEHP